MKNKFYEFKNIAENENDLYIYGEIVDEKEPDFWTGEINENQVDIADFRKTLSTLPANSKLNMYINSPGGSVFATSSIMSMLQRAKDKGLKIDAYIDGVACSCASWLPMVADNIFIYKNSVMMIHKPLVMTYGNANDLQKDIEVLNKIEDGVIVPMYETKAKCDKKKLKNLMADETWLTAEEIQEVFNVEYIEEAKKVENIQSDLFNTYKNTPKEFKQEQKPVENMAETSQQEENEKVVETSQPEKEVKIDYSNFENEIKKIKGEK